MHHYANSSYGDLFSFIENFLKENGIPVHYLKTDEDIVENVDLGLRSGILKYDSTLKDIQKFFHQMKPNTLYFLTDLFCCNYATFLLPDKKTIFHCGPMLFNHVSKEQIQESLAKYGIPEGYETSLHEYYNKVPVVAAFSFFETLFLQLMRTIHHDDYEVVHDSYDDITTPILNSPSNFHPADNLFSDVDLMARRYALENELIQTVLSGKEPLVLEFAEKSLSAIAELPSRVSSPLRNMKNYMIALNTLLRKSMELNGVHPIYCDATSGQFVIEIERCTSTDQFYPFFKKLLLTYCKIAKKTSHLNHSPFVDTVLTYIDADLRADLSLKTLANHLNVNASYLSALFSEEMGISLTNYVTQCRIEHAKKLLTHSNLSVKNIALQCGFSDIHYFSRQFKKYTEMSPKIYREQETLLRDFHMIEQLKKKKN